MTTPLLQLPEVPQAILGASDELNEGFWTLDALSHLSVISRTVTVPPLTAQQGDRYIIPSGATDVWEGRTNHVAYMTPDGWRYFVPRPGWIAYVRGDTPRRLCLYEGSQWNDLVGGNSLRTNPRGATWARSGAAIATPVDPVRIYFDVACRIAGVVVLTGEAAGSCSINILKDPIGSYPPSTSIVASAPPVISSGRTYIDTSLTGWTRDISAGDVVAFDLQSSSTFRSVHCSLLLERA